MKYSLLCAIAIMFIVAAVTIAGCFSMGSTAPAAEGTSSSTNSLDTAAGASSAPAAGSVVSGANLFANSNSKWYEYWVAENGELSDIKTEVSEDIYHGKAATHTKITITMITPIAATTVYDMYVDTCGVSLGGHTKMISNGQTIMDQDIQSFAPMQMDQYIDKNAQYTFVGIEHVSVPAGTYPVTMKYTGTFKGSKMGTFWTVPGVPTFVKIAHNSETQELVGWG